MSISEILTKEMRKSKGRAQVVKVPALRRPDAESLRNLEREISAQINVNEAMRNRSILMAAKTF